MENQGNRDDNDFQDQNLRGIAYNIEHAAIDRAYYVLPDNRPDQQQIEIMEREFAACVNQRSRLKAKSSIMKGYGDEFDEPRTEVLPKLAKTNFYRGGSSLDEVEYSVMNERGRLTTKQRKREVEVQLETIHTHGRYIAIIGGAGSGKTTLLNRYCLQVLDGRIECMKGVKLVHLINIKDWSLKNEKYTVMEILFSVFNIASGDTVKYGFEWLKSPENQESFLILLDGMDTAPWVLRDDVHHDVIGYDDKASVPVIIYNILYGNLFPYCKILLTSREYGIIRFPEDIRPDATIALRGFSRRSIMLLVKEIGGDRGDFILESMLQKSLKLMLLCSTPLFLIFVIIVHLQGEEVPENLSRLITTILKNHLRSKHQKVKDNTDVIIEKLMSVSLDGLESGRVVFNKVDFERNALDVVHVKDLVISVPTQGRNIICDHNLLEEDYSFFFVHQTIQELLAACKIASLPLEQFEKLIDNNIHTSKFGVVRQMLCGVMFNKSETAMDFIKNRNEDGDAAQDLVRRKQEYLLESLRKELNDGNISPMKMLNLLICLCECGSEDERIIRLIKSSIKKIYLSGIPLTTSDLHALASVASHCDRLSFMALDNCQLTKFDLKVLSDGLGESDVEITVFDVCFNRGLRKDSMYYVHKICIRGQGLNYWQCGFRQIDILDFNEARAERLALELQDVNIEEHDNIEERQISKMFRDQNILDFSDYNTKHHFQTLQNLVGRANEKDSFDVSLTEYERNSDLTNLCRLLQMCRKIGEFKISESELTEAQLDKIMQAIPTQKITMVNVFLTPNIQPKGWKKIGQIAKKFKAGNLAVTACSLTFQKLTELKVSLDGTKIYRFDMSRNGDMDENCLKQAGGIIGGCTIKELIMGYCNLTGRHMNCLRISLRNGNEAAEIYRIDVSGNDSMGEDGFGELGQIVDMCKTKELDFSECDPTAQEIRSFKEAIHTAEITKLNVSRNRHMGAWGLHDVGQLVGKCHLKNLFVRQCELEERTMEKFAEGLGDAKIEHLDFGLYFMKPRPTTEAEINILLGLLPNITKELTLNAWSFGSREHEYEQLLQDKLDELPFVEPGIKIVFDRGQARFIQQRKID